jgi:hypothetical protein
MANWNNPTVTSLYTDFVTEVKNRDLDVAKGMDPAIVTVTNPVANMIRWNSANRYWEIYSGASWGAWLSYYAIEVGAFTGDVTKSAGSSALTIAAALKFAAGTRLMFQQTSAPTGWTKDTSATYNDAAPRFTTGTVGTGGSVVFSTAFVSGAVTGSTAPGLQAHTHTGTTGNASVDHTHTFSATSSGHSVDHAHQEKAYGPDFTIKSLVEENVGGGTGNNVDTLLIDVVDTGPPPGTPLNTGGASVDHTHTVSGTSAGVSVTHTHAFTSDSTGSGSDHTHTTASANLKYADCIVASKD